MRTTYLGRTCEKGKRFSGEIFGYQRIHLFFLSENGVVSFIDIDVIFVIMLDVSNIATYPMEKKKKHSYRSKVH